MEKKSLIPVQDSPCCRKYKFTENIYFDDIPEEVIEEEIIMEVQDFEDTVEKQIPEEVQGYSNEQDFKEEVQDCVDRVEDDIMKEDDEQHSASSRESYSYTSTNRVRDGTHVYAVPQNEL